MSGTIFGFDATTVETFDAAYKAAQPPCVQALFTMDATQAERLAMAQKLASQGFFIDYPVMVWGWDAYMTMYLRQMDGYTTYPDMLNEQTRPVDLNPTDYPAFPVPPAPAQTLVGASIGGGPYYFLTATAAAMSLPAGYMTMQGGHTYVLIMVAQQTFSSVQMIPRFLQVS